MNLIAIETSGLVGSVALARDGAVLVEREFGRRLEHGRDLIPALDLAMSEAGWRFPPDVDLIAVSIGPGSFTGLRVGIATVKALAYAGGKGVVGVGSLDALAENAPADAGHVCPVVDAKRGQVYAAVFSRAEEATGPARPDAGGDAALPRAGGAWRRETPDLLLRPDELLGRLPRPALLLGDGLRAHGAALTGPGLSHAEDALWRARAGAVARLGYRLAVGGKRDDPATLAPIYLRRPEAEEKRLAREGQS